MWWRRAPLRGVQRAKRPRFGLREKKSETFSIFLSFFARQFRLVTLDALFSRRERRPLASRHPKTGPDSPPRSHRLPGPSAARVRPRKHPLGAQGRLLWRTDMDRGVVIDHDENACYRALVGLLHPRGLACPRCGDRGGWRVHRSHRAPVIDYRCPNCRRIFNAWTGTPLRNAHLPPSVLWQLLCAVADNETAAGLARGAGLPRSTLLRWRHRLREVLANCLPANEPTLPHTRQERLADLC